MPRSDRKTKSTEPTIRVQLHARKLSASEFTPIVAAILHQGNQFKTLALEFEVQGFPSQEAALQSGKDAVTEYLNEKHPEAKVYFSKEK